MSHGIGSRTLCSHISLEMPRQDKKEDRTVEEIISRKITWLLRWCYDFHCKENLSAEGFATLNSVITYLRLADLAHESEIIRAIETSNNDGLPRFELRSFWIGHPSRIIKCVKVCNQKSNHVRKRRWNNTRTPPASFWEETWPNTERQKESWQTPWPETREEPWTEDPYQEGSWQENSQEESGQKGSWHKTGQEKHDNWHKESQEEWQEEPLYKPGQQSWREGHEQEESWQIGSWQKESWKKTWKEEWPKRSWQGEPWQKPWRKPWRKEEAWEKKGEDQDLNWQVVADPCWNDGHQPNRHA